MKFAGIAAFALALPLMTAGVDAATLSGNFSVTAVNVTNLDSTQSQATNGNYQTALAGTFGGSHTYISDVFNYIGDLDFRVGGPQTANPYTIGTWLGTGSGAGEGNVVGLSAALANAQLSFPDINSGNATTTFFFFTLLAPLSAGDFTVTHDDGIALYDDGVRRGGNVGPTGETTTNVSGFDGGKFSLLYVATNGNPSILEVGTTASVVPLPAGGLLLLSGLGALVAAGRRRRAAA